jgi:hypothetical protein
MGKLGARKAVGKTTPRGESQMEKRKLSVFGRILRTEPHTYNSHQLIEKLEQEPSIKFSPDRLKRVLKKSGSI